MNKLERLTAQPQTPGTDEARLSDLVQAAAPRERLAPDAYRRVADRLDAEEARGGWRLSWWMPAVATAALACTIWARHGERPATMPTTTVAAVTGPRASQASRAAMAPKPTDEVALRDPGPLPPIGDARLVLLSSGRVLAMGSSIRLIEGSLAVMTDAKALNVASPAADVLVDPHSAVRIQLRAEKIRVAADAGSAHVTYAGGQSQVVRPVRHHAKVALRGETHVAAEKIDASSGSISDAPSATVAIAPEWAHLATALAMFRAAPADALASLDEHVALYPNGESRADAERARIALLLKLGRPADALAILDDVDAPRDELRVIRGELRAERGRTREAIVDFNAALVGADAEAQRLEERALFGRAMCHKRLAELEPMRRDLERYVAQYPHGVFAERARDALGTGQGPTR